MCSVSAVFDTWNDKWNDKFVGWPYTPPNPGILDWAQREQLKKEIEEFRQILKRAKAWDKAHPQEEPCDETPAKIEALRELVRQLGLEEEVEIVLKEFEEEDEDVVITVPTVTTTRNTGGFVHTGGTGRVLGNQSISVGGPGYYDDPSSYT